MLKLHIFKQLTKINKWSLIAYLSIIFLCIAISYEIIETYNHKSIFFKNWLDNNIKLFSQL